jgi:hypothetical protein
MMDQKAKEEEIARKELEIQKAKERVQQEEMKKKFEEQQRIQQAKIE